MTTGCFECEITCKHEIEQGDVWTFFNRNFECQCNIWKCLSVVYFRHDANKLARQKQLHIEIGNSTLSQPKLNYFFVFTKALAKMTSTQLYNVDEADDAMALTAIDLSNSNTLSKNIVLRNNFKQILVC